MKKFGFAAVAAAVVAIFAAPVMAADFTGPRVEARIGVDSVHLNAANGSASGLTFGGGIGYDYALTERVRVGVEAGVDSSTTSKNFDGLLKADARRDIEVGGRIGYVLTPALLVYGKAAYTNAQIGYSFDTATKKVTIGHSDGDGYRLGGGFEFAATKHIYGKVEYRYSDYGNGDRRNQVVTGAGVRF